MRRKVFLLSAGAAVVALLLFALGSQTPAANADDSSMSWDVVMYAGEGTNPHCTPSTTPDILTGECPDVESNLWIETDQNGVSNEEFFDLANTIWEVDGYQESTHDLNGDTVVDPGYIIPVNGLRATPGDLLNLGATTGNISFGICGNVVPASVSFANNIDDVATNADATARGQSAECDENTSQFSDSFDIWDAVVYPTESAFLVPVSDNDGDGSPDAQNDHFSFGEDCEGPYAAGTPNGMPDAIDCTPTALVNTINASGFGPYLQGRAYGIAELVITPSISTYIDVNFMVFNLLTEPEAQGYLSLTVVQYPDAPALDPGAPGYKPTSQTVTTCPPYYSSPVHLYGITQATHFAGPPVKDVAGGQINRQMMGAEVSGPHDYYINKSVSEDYDGDTIANVYDRCDYDPASGTAAQDLDGDTLTGLCDDNEDATCPAGQTLGCPGNPQDTLPAGWNTAPPWDTGQDQDGDTQVNRTDNCPQHANYAGDPAPGNDADNDNVGDVCEIALYGAGTELIPGNGDGYAAPAPGTYLDHDNRCVDQYSVGAPEPRSEAGAVPGKYCYVNEATFAVNYPPPYDATPNPPLASLMITYDDSNDDGDPDWADLNNDTVYQIGEPIDTDDNTDNPDPGGAGDTLDYESDACEAVPVTTDPLDPTSKGTSGTVTMMDCDGDNVSDAAEEAAGTNPFNAASFPNEITKAIVSVEVDGDWSQVNPAPAGSENDPLPGGVPALPHADPPAAIQLDVATPTVVLTDDLDWSSAHIWIDKTVTLTVTAGNCTVDGGAVSVQGPLNEEEDQGWSLEPAKLSWTINMADDGGCTIQYTVLKQIKSPPNPPDLTFAPQTVNLTINVTETTACVFANDADCDACYDIREPGLTPPANSADAWDFYDVPVPTLFSGGHISGDPSGTDSRDHAISIINDVLAVLEYSGCSDGGPANAAGRQYNQDVNGDTVNDGQAYDRSVGATRSGTPDGAVTIIVDVLLVLAQSGQACAAP